MNPDTLELDLPLASLFDENPDALLLYDRDGVCVRCNAAAEELSGYDAAELRSSSLVESAHPRDRGMVAAALQAALAGRAEHFEATIRRRDGAIVPVECHVFPARRGSEVVGVYAQARDLVALRSAEQSLALFQDRSRSLFEYHPDSIMALKSNGEISRVNVALEQATGYFGEQLINRAWTDLIAPEARAVAQDAFLISARGEASELDSLLLDRLGNRIDVQLKIVPLRSLDCVDGAYVIAKNVTAERSMERALARQHERMRELYLVAAARQDDAHAQIDAVLQLGCRLFGFDYAYVARYSDGTLIVENAIGDKTPVVKGAAFPREMTFSRYVTAQEPTLFIADLDAGAWGSDPARKSASAWRSYFATRLSVTGEEFGVLVFAGRFPRDAGLDDVDRDLIQLMGLFVAEAIERRRHEEHIEQLAFFDSLTGLPNRVLLADRIRQTMKTARRYNRGFAVMYVDLDGFKGINDTYGHTVGDRLLKAVADRLLLTLRESDTVARFGGDEFVILQPVVNGAADCSDLARKIVSAMQNSLMVDDHQLHVRCSIGIAMYPDDGETTEEIMDRADRALYRAKNAGRNRWNFYDDRAARREWPAINRRPVRSAGLPPESTTFPERSS